MHSNQGIAERDLTLKDYETKTAYTRRKKILLSLCLVLIFIKYSQISIGQVTGIEPFLHIGYPNAIINFIWLFFIYFLVTYTVNSNRWSSVDFKKYESEFLKKKYLPELYNRIPTFVEIQPGIITNANLKFRLSKSGFDSSHLWYRYEKFNYKIFSLNITKILGNMPCKSNARLHYRMNLIRKNASLFSRIKHGVKPKRGLLFWLFYPTTSPSNRFTWEIILYSDISALYIVYTEYIINVIRLSFARGLFLKLKIYNRVYFRTDYYFDNKLPVHLALATIIYYLADKAEKVVNYITVNLSFI